MSDTLPSGWKEAPADDLPPGWAAAPSSEEDELPPGWKQPTYTRGEQVAEFGKNIVAGAVDPVAGLLKGLGAGVSAGTPLADYSAVGGLAAAQQRELDMSPLDVVPPELSYPRATDVRQSRIFQAGKALEEKTAALLGLREGVLPDLARDVGKGLGQLGTNIGIGMIPGVGLPLVTGTGALGGIGEAGERAAGAGASPEQQQASLKYGAAAGATELADAAIPRLGVAGQALSLLPRIAVKAGIGSGVEAVQEGVQQGIQNLGAQNVYNPAQELSEGVGYNALVGGIVGGVGGGALAGRRATPAEQGVPAQPGLPAQPEAAQAPPEAAPAPAPAAGEVTRPQAAVPAAPDPVAVAAAQQEVEKEILQTQRFETMKQMMVAEEMGDDLAAEAAQQQYDTLGQQLASMRAGTADPLLEGAELARLPLREQLEASVALLGPQAPEPERILHVAVRRNGAVNIGTTHPDAIYEAIAKEGKSADDLTDADYAAFENGFLTNTGRFVDRQEADQIARGQGQIGQDLGPGGLSSENLAPWTDEDAKVGLPQVEEFSSRGRGAPTSPTSTPQTAEPGAPAAQPPPTGAAPEGVVQPREAAESRTVAPSIHEQPEWYYSAVERTARERLPNAGTVEQFWSTLSGAPGVKQEELERLGVKDYLDAVYGPRATVSKEDLLTHLNEQAIEVETHVFGSAMAQPWTAVQVPGMPQPEGPTPAALLGVTEEFPPNTIPFQENFNRTPVYQAWEVPSGAGTGWMVVRARDPTRGSTNFYEVNPAGFIQGRTHTTLGAAKAAVEGRIDSGRRPLYGSYMPSIGGTNYQEVVLATPERRHDDNVYSTRHFPAMPNKVGWFQKEDVRGVNGEHLMAIRGIQDDTRQQGRQEGYRDQKAADAMRAKLEELRKEYNDKQRREEEMDPLYEANDADYKRLNEPGLAKPVWDKIYAGIRARQDELAKLRATREWISIVADQDMARKALRVAEGGLPDVPFKNQWHEVVVKRILRLAADEGYDAVIFPPPSQVISEWQGDTDEKRAEFFQLHYGQKIPQAYRKWGKQLGGTVEQFGFEGPSTRLGGTTTRRFWEGVRVTPEMRTETKRRGLPLFSRTATGPKGLAYVTSENGLPMDTVMRFGPDLMRFVQAMEVMQEKYGLNFPIEVKLSGSARVPGKAVVDFDRRGKITKGYIELGAQFHQSSAELYASLVHEFGHIFLWQNEASMPTATRMARDNDYEAFRRETRDLGIPFEDMIARRDNFITQQNSFRVTDRAGVRTGRGTQTGQQVGDFLLSDLSGKDRRYFLGKEEWTVEQVARFFTTNEAALTVVEKYHKSFANRLREMYTYFKRKLGLTAEAGPWLQDWMLQIQQENTAFGEIAAGKDAATKRSNQAAMDADGASMTAVPESGVTQDLRRLVAESSTVGLPPNAAANGRALAAYADYFNTVYKYAAGLPHLAAANTHIGPLQRYNEINQQWDLEVSNMIDGGTRVLKEWRNRDQPQQDAMTAMIDDYRMMRYLTPAEVAAGVERMPSPLEVDALAAKHGVSKNSQAAFGAVVQSYDAVVLKYRQELRRQARKISDPLRRQMAYQDIDKQINAIRAKPFVPGMQFGNHTVVMRDSTGKIIHREAFDTKRKRNAALRQLATQVPPGGRIDPSFIDKDARPLIGLPPGLLDLIEQRLTLSASQQKAIEELKFELHPTQSFKHRFSNLNLVAGSSKDFQRGYANFFFHGAHYFGRVKYQEAARQEAQDLQESAQGIFHQGGTDAAFGKREEISKYVNNHLQYRLDPRPDFAMLRSLGFLWYLGFVPAAAVLNVTQIPLATMPFLSAKFGDRKAIAAILDAGRRISSFYKKGTMATQTAEELWALDQGIKSGTITEAMAPEMAAIAELDNLTRSTKGYTLRAWHKTLEHSAKMFELAEQFNRRVTFRASYALAKANPSAKYVGEAVQKHYLQYQSIIAQLGSTVPDPAARAAAFVAAKDSTEQTQGIYKQYAEPKIMRGKWRTVLLFKSFYVNTLMMYWNNKEARIRGMLAFAALGGLMGLPFTEDIKGLVRLLGTLFGKDWDLEKEMKKLLMSILGDDEADDAEWADIMLHGMSRIGFGVPQVLQHLGVPGPKAGNDVRSGQVDMSKSISLGRGIPVDLNQLATASNTDKAMFRAIGQAAGPVYGGMGMSLYKFLDGGGYKWDDRKAWEYLMPRAMKSVSQGFRAFDEGRERNARGETVIRYDRTDPWQVSEAIALGLGFQPARLTAEWDRRMARLEDTTYWAARQQTIMQQMWLARGDPEESARVSAAMRAFNQEIVGTPAAMYAVTAQGLRASFQARAKGAQAAETGIPVRRREIPIAREVERMYPAPRVVVEKERVR